VTPSPPPQLITLDVGHTLGAVRGRPLTAVLAAASPLPAEQARRVIRQRLYTMAHLDQDVVALVCRKLQIPAEAFPRDHRPPAFEFWPGAAEAVAELASVLPVATLSNVCRPDDDGSVARVLGPYLSGHHPSYLIGYAKPDPRAFTAVAAAHGVPPAAIIHLGDSLELDVRAALRVGARAVWITTSPPTAADLVTAADRLGVAPTVQSAVAHVRALLNPSARHHTR
jgi:FMN phosphatase YigB (HAD superfamily)